MLLQHYLEQSSAKFTSKVAIKYKSESMTYGQLEILSNQVAHTLLDQGVLPGTTVGLFIGKSIEAVVALFGILKAGAIYVPLDSDSPVERTRFIVANCKIGAIVIDDKNYFKLEQNKDKFSTNLLLLNSSKKQLNDAPSGWRLLNRMEIESRPQTIPQIELPSENDLAYILYTSGSTGDPKGVMLTHRNAVIYVDWAASYLELDSEDIFSSHAPFHFDLSIFDLFVSLKLGATLCLIPPGISYFPDAVLRFIQENKITVWYSVPSALIQLLTLHDDLKAKMRSITTLIYAGEVFPYPYLNQLIEQLSNAEIYNFYGPTETNVITYFQVKMNAGDLLSENVPIGKPCPYAKTYIVNENKQTVKTGETGELIVNGESLMKGYWNDPVKSSTKIQKVHVNGADDFFYFTGDIVVEREDGNIVYVNRRDNMVKTRGFRVELGEIENALHKHSAVQRAAIIAIKDDKIGHRLVAFVVIKKGVTLSLDDINKHCGELLPAYMIPEKINYLQDIPISANGKIDRERLKKLYFAT